MFWWVPGMQFMVSENGHFLDFLHDYICCILIFILLLVGGLLLYFISSGWIFIGWVEASVIEFIWTVFPIVILFFIGIPSMWVLYFHEMEPDPLLSVKVVGHQWYWSYDYSGMEVEFDSFMLPLNELNIGDFRLLECDNSIVLPFFCPIRLAITSADVLHSWALPSLGVKVDATPGRLCFINILISEPGNFYGQCSEICGANHSFMPISLSGVSLSDFFSWISEFY